MSFFYTLFIVSILIWPGSLLVLADSPPFYLVASAQGSANLQPLRPYGGLNGASLTGTSPIGQFYFDSEGALRTTIPPPSGSTMVAQAYLVFTPTGNSCTAYAAFGFIAGSQMDPCKRAATTKIVTNPDGMGSKLSVIGMSLYACGNSLDVYLEPKPGYGPPGLTCTPIALFIIPV